ncbi:MAG: hypothetical protein ACKO96_13190 [Flammeovirgaceae bacterium]
MRTQMIRQRLGTTILFLATLTSCDCVVDRKGFVLNSRTEKPIANATVRLYKREYKTDSIGFFKIHYITGFCADCDFEIEKQNYRTEKLTIELDDNEIIYKARRSNEEERQSGGFNSLNFKVKDDTIFFYLATEK